MKNAEPVLLEPVMWVRVVGPTENMADVTENLAGRRGEIESQAAYGPTTIVRARVPLAEMLGYAMYLRSRTEGRGTYSLTFDRYEPFPGDIGSDDRSSLVGAPRRPAPTIRRSALAVPEPDDDRDDRLKGR